MAQCVHVCRIPTPETPKSRVISDIRTISAIAGAEETTRRVPVELCTQYMGLRGSGGPDEAYEPRVCDRINVSRRWDR